MARKPAQEEQTEEFAGELTKRARIHPTQKQIVTTLRSIAACYHEAARALGESDFEAYESALDLVTTYQSVHEKLLKRFGDTMTAEGLASVEE